MINSLVTSAKQVRTKKPICKAELRKEVRTEIAVRKVKVRSGVRTENLKKPKVDGTKMRRVKNAVGATIAAKQGDSCPARQRRATRPSGCACAANNQVLSGGMRCTSGTRMNRLFSELAGLLFMSRLTGPFDALGCLVRLATWRLHGTKPCTAGYMVAT